MIFKQRFFTLLLSFLFATVLTDQASALYDPGVGRFCSRDPIGYADGKNLQMAYFAPSATDPFGQQIQILVKKGADHASEGPCGGKGQVSKSWRFRLSKNHKTKGWLIQQVIVACAIGTCTDSITLETTCGVETHPACYCNADDDFDLFVYYEAWRVGYNQEEPEIPEEANKGPHNTEPNITDKAAYLIPNVVHNSCGSIVQYGVLKYFSEGTIGNLDNDSLWKPRPDHSYGRLPFCFTSAGHLHTYSGQGAPAAWLSPPLATGWRVSDFSWKCCECDLKKNQRGKVTGFPN